MSSNRFTEDKNARFALFVSLSIVDGEIGDAEYNFLKKIKKHYGFPKEKNKNVEESKKSLIEESKTNIHEILTNIPKDNFEKFKDLLVCYSIILIDDTITDAEKNAFDIICRFYGIRKELFIELERRDIIKLDCAENIIKSVEEVLDSKEKDLLQIKKLLHKSLTECDEFKKVRIKRDGYSKIEEVFQYNLIKGPLLEGIKYALEKRYNEVERNKIRSEKKSTRFAFVIFIISAFILFFTLTNISHQSQEIEKELTHELIQKDHNIDLEERKIEIKKEIIEERKETLNDPIDVWITKLSKKKERKMILAGATIVCVIIFYALKIISKHFYNKIKWGINKYPYPFICLGMLFILLFFWQHITAALLLFAMLSIEWLILMKEQTHNENNSNILLTILVLMAILTDISFGMIELEQVYTLTGIMDKIFSALFLGCICFFCGKFMEIQYKQSEKNRNDMKDVLLRIKKKPQ